MSYLSKRSFVSQYSDSGNKAYLTLPLAQTSDHGVDNTKVVGLNPVWAINIRAGLGDPCGCLPTQSSVQPVTFPFPAIPARPGVFALPAAISTSDSAVPVPPARPRVPGRGEREQNSSERSGRAQFLHLPRRRSGRAWCLSSAVNVQRIQECHTDGGMLWGLVASKALSAHCEWVIWVETSRGQGNDVCPSGNAGQSQERGRGCYTTLLPIPVKNRHQVCKIPLAPLLHQHKVNKLRHRTVFLL